MDRPFQKWLMEQAAARLKPNQVLFHEIQAALGYGSESNLYKKIRSETELRLEEAALIAQHFDIPLDQYAHRDKPSRAVFEYPPLGQAFRSPSDFLGLLSREMAHILGTPSPSVWYATNEIPIFHYMPHRHLLAFKLFVWARTSWLLPAYTQAKFSAEDMYAQHPAIDQYRESISAFYAQVPTKEYWPPHILDHTLSQMRHCAHAGFFIQPDVWKVLLAELRTMLNNSLEAAHRGQKADDGGAPGAGFELFFNEFAYTNNTILIFSAAHPVSLFVTFDNPNFGKSTSTEICQKMAHWIGRIERSAVRVSQSNEQQRHRLFDEVRAKIKALEQELAE